MPQVFTLENDKLIAKVSTLGAELQSLYSKETQLEYMWQPGHDIWNHHSLLLFPNAGRIADDRILINGKAYPAMMHGFAKDMEFNVVEQTQDSIILVARSNDYTLQYFPYAFNLRVNFACEGNKLIQRFIVENTDSQPFNFCLGAHPGFYCPIVLGEKVTDYQLEFDTPQSILQMKLQPNTSLILGPDKYLLQNERIIALDDHFFDHGGKLLTQVNAQTVTLKSTVSGRFVELSISGFPFLCLWGPSTRLSLICIEPWIGTSDRADTDHVWETKPGSITLQKNEKYIQDLTFRIG